MMTRQDLTPITRPGSPAGQHHGHRGGGIRQLARRSNGTGTRAETPRTIALIACLGAALAIAGCGDPPQPPATPVLLGVLDDGCAEIPGGTSGGFKLLPAGAVRARVVAAWPSADLVVKANGTELEKVGPSDTQRQRDLKDAKTAYWVPADINPNPNTPVWTVYVDLPESMRAGPLTLELTSRVPGGASSSPLSVEVVQDMQATAQAWNRVQLDWRDRIGNAQGYLLERSEGGASFIALTSLPPGTSRHIDTVKGKTTYSYRLTAQGCPPTTPGGPASFSKGGPVSVTTPAETGVDEIALFRSTDPADDQFDYTNPNSLFMPEGAVVTSVTNVSANENVDLPLGSVRHTDANGRPGDLLGTCPDGILQKGQSTPAFNGQTVEGEWRVRVCANAIFLEPPARIALSIDWTL